MSNEFNLERAKAGQPVEFRRAATSTWELVYFVGLSNSGAPVIEMHECADVFKVNVGLLRMAPKKVKVRYRVALMDSLHRKGETSPYAVVPEEEDSIVSSGYFKQWLSDWQETEANE